MTNRRRLENAGIDDYSKTNGIYTIQKGDNLTSIAKRYNTTVENLAKLNNIKDTNKIYTGNQLRLVDTIEKTRRYVAGQHVTPKSTMTDAQRDSVRKAYYKTEVDKINKAKRTADSIASERIANAVAAAKNRYNIYRLPSSETNVLSNNISPRTISANGRIFQEQIDGTPSVEIFGRHITPKGLQQTEAQRRASLRNYVKQNRKPLP